MRGSGPSEFRRGTRLAGSGRARRARTDGAGPTATARMRGVSRSTSGMCSWRGGQRCLRRFTVFPSATPSPLSMPLPFPSLASEASRATSPSVCLRGLLTLRLFEAILRTLRLAADLALSGLIQKPKKDEMARCIADLNKGAQVGLQRFGFLAKNKPDAESVKAAFVRFYDAFTSEDEAVSGISPCVRQVRLPSAFRRRIRSSRADFVRPSARRNSSPSASTSHAPSSLKTTSARRSAAAGATSSAAEPGFSKRRARGRSSWDWCGSAQRDIGESAPSVVTGCGLWWVYRSRTP